MKIRRLLFFVMITAAVGFIWSCSGTGQQRDSQPPVNVTILFFNDLHGHLLPFFAKTDAGKEKVGGIARMATMIKRIREENNRIGAKTLVLVAGDVLQGTPMSTVFQGWPDVECFNAMGVDAMTVGNHEFDFNLENFLTLKKAAAFPFLSSNIIWKDNGRLVCDPYATFQISDSVSLTVIGATTRQLLTTTRPQYVEKIDVLDPVQTVRQAVDQLKGRGPVLLLSHSKHKTDRAIALAVPELAAIIGGHDQILLSPFRKVGNVPIFQAFEKGRYLGRLDVKMDSATRSARLISYSYIPVTDQIDPESEIERIIAQYRERLDKKFKVSIGQSRTVLDGERNNVRYIETALGNFVTDIMREYTGARIALLNGGSLRASINAGPVTLEDVFKAVPYANEIVLISLTGADLHHALTRSVAGKPEDEDGGFLHVSGIRFTIRGHAVENVRVGQDQAPLDPAKIYRVAITDFLVSGGDGYTIFTGKPALHTGLPLRELVVEMFRTRRSVSAVVEGRIVRIASPAFK